MVPNDLPTVSTPYRIAFVGEAPGRDEAEQLRPFVGASGRLFNDCLGKARILRAGCLVGNVCQHQPPNNIIAHFPWDSDEIQSGISNLTTDLKLLNPNLVVTLGNTPLHLFKAGNIPVRVGKKDNAPSFSFPNKVSDWRGSTFTASPTSPFPGVKCLAALHPALCLRQFEYTPMLIFDLGRAYREGHYPDLRHPQRDISIATTVPQVVFFLRAIRQNHRSISPDLEGYWQGMSCIGISSSGRCLVIPFTRRDGTSYWDFESELTILHELALTMADPTVPKTWQNGLYDRWVFHYGYDALVLGNTDDTMPKFWEKYCELRKGLATQVSLLTDQPYYKGDRKSQDDTTFFTYCGLDAHCTEEINSRLTPLLAAHGPTATLHYRFNHALLNLFLYIELRGMAYDTALAKQRLIEVENHRYTLQHQLDVAAGYHIPNTPEARLSMVREVMAYKRDPNIPKKDYADAFPDSLRIAAQTSLSARDCGFLGTSLGVDLNTKSARFKSWLKSTFGEDVPETDAGNPKADALTLMRLWKKTNSPLMELAMQVGWLRTRQQMLHIKADPDGRIRSSYNGVGTVTGRITSGTSPTGSGYNLQTIPDEDHSKPPGHPLYHGMRDLIVADPGHWLFQCDLKGSDGWTIGAHLNRLGDSTMLDDLRAGIKPAARIAYMLRHGVTSLRGRPRTEIASLLQEIKKDDWDYFALKIGIWGMCYLMGPDLLSDVIFEESDGKINLSRKEVNTFREAVMTGYSVHLWHRWMSTHLSKTPVLVSASGNIRRFYGRTTEILGEALAHEPQNNTTYATNLAAYRLWVDPENRTERSVTTSHGTIRTPFQIEPLHQVHDALIGQFPKTLTEWAVPKIRTYFNNPLTIAGQQIIIPFEGHFGPSWGEQIKENVI